MGGLSGEGAEESVGRCSRQREQQVQGFAEVSFSTGRIF